MHKRVEAGEQDGSQDGPGARETSGDLYQNGTKHRAHDNRPSRFGQRR